MNAQQFKKLIKEAVRDAVREELRAVLSENQQPLQETKTFNFNSNDVMKGGLPHDARNSLRAKMGMEFGFQQPQLNELKVINSARSLALISYESRHLKKTTRILGAHIACLSLCDFFCIKKVTQF